MKHLSRLIIVAIVFVCLSAPVSAQKVLSSDIDSETKIKNIEGLELQLLQHTQDPITYHVKYSLVITSSIRSDRTQLTWEIEGSSEIVSVDGQEWDSDGSPVINMLVSPGQSYTREIVIWPRTFGTTEINAKVEAFEVDGTKIATASKIIGSFESGELFEHDQYYLFAQVLAYGRLVALGLLVLVSIYYWGFWSYYKFRDWLDNRNT